MPFIQLLMSSKTQFVKRRSWGILAFLFCLNGLCPAYAGIDAMQLRLLEAYQQELRWDNIESSPEWLNGVKPYYHKDWRMHRVLLGPKQQSTFILPAYESLRVYHPSQILTGKEIDILTSNGTGLAIKQTPQHSTDGHSLVVSPNSATPLLVHINRPYFYTSDVEVALFISRKVPINDIAPYRNLVWSSARWSLLSQQPSALPELYKQLPARQKQTIHVQGPARLVIKNRLDYERRASELIQDYRIRYWLDANQPQDLHFATSVETSRIITVNALLEIVGREEQGYIEIPNGHHQLALESDRPLYVQVLAQTEEDYLFKHLNNPVLPVETIRNQNLLPTTILSQQEQTAKRIAQDNSHREAGLVGSNLLKKAALQRPDYPEGLREAEQLKGFRTFYRDLLPSKKAANLPQFMAYFLTKTLPAINRPQSDAILPEQHFADALQRLSSGYFTSLTDIGEDAANIYTLPEQQTAGQLRIIVDKRDCLERLLRVKINEEPTTDMWLRCDKERQPEWFNQPLAEAALARLQQERFSENVSLDGLFSAYQPNAKMISSAVFELPLPINVRTIKLWQASERKPKPVQIALQYRAAKPYLLSEHSYLESLRDWSAKTVSTQLRQYPQPKTARTAKLLDTPTQILENEWLPLKRLLQAEYNLYKASVSASPYSNTSKSIASEQVINQTITLAKTLEKQQNWLEALEQWGKVVNYSDGLAKQQAQLAQAQVLTKLGETYLAENLRRYLSFYAETAIAEQAYTELTKQYQTQNNNTALQTLAAAMFVQRPNPEHRHDLINGLLKNGEYRFVLLLGLSFIEQPPLESLLTAAYHLDWWESYDWLEKHFPPTQRLFWQGLKAQKQGDYATALHMWSAKPLQTWHQYLQQGLQLRDTFVHAPKTNLLAWYGQWSAWQQAYPGNETWQNALWHVTDYAGSDSYYAVDRDVYGQAVRATKNRPVTLGVLGPLTLNLQIRPLHPNNKPDSALDGWLQITDNQQSTRFPFTNNQPSQGLKVTGMDDLQLGTLVSLVYEVGQGWHEIQLNSEQAPLSIAIQEQRPETPLTVLPTLQTDTLAEMALLNLFPKHPVTFRDLKKGWLWH